MFEVSVVKLVALALIDFTRLQGSACRYRLAAIRIILPPQFLPSRWLAASPPCRPASLAQPIGYERIYPSEKPYMDDIYNFLH